MADDAVRSEGQASHSNSPVWNAAMLDLLRGHASNGLSASKIADEMRHFVPGVTRNSVLGACKRYGISLGVPSCRPSISHGSVSVSVSVSDNALRSAAIPAARLRPRPAPMPPASPSPVASPVGLPERPAGSPISLLDLTFSTCRWPIGDPGDPSFGYCGALADGASGPYCPHHRAIAYQPSARRVARDREISRGVRA